MNGSNYCHVSAQIAQHAHDEGMREAREIKIESQSERVFDDYKKALDTSCVNIAPRHHTVKNTEDVMNALLVLAGDPDLSLNKAIDLVVKEKLGSEQ